MVSANPVDDQVVAAMAEVVTDVIYDYLLVKRLWTETIAKNEVQCLQKRHSQGIKLIVYFARRPLIIGWMIGDQFHVGLAQTSAAELDISPRVSGEFYALNLSNPTLKEELAQWFQLPKAHYRMIWSAIRTIETNKKKKKAK